MYLIALGFSALCFLGVGTYFVRSSAFSVFHPLTMYLAFHGLLFVVRPLLVYVAAYDTIYRAYEFTPSLNDKLTVLLASNLGFLVFAALCLRTGGVAMRFERSAAVQEERLHLTKPFIWSVALLGPLVIYSLVRSYGSDSLYGGIILDPTTGVFINTTNIGYVLDLQIMGASLSAIAAWLLRFRLYSLLPLLGFVLMRAGQGGRGPFVVALASAGLFYLYDRGIKAPRPAVLLGVALVAAAFTAVGQDRGASLRQAAGVEQRDTFAGGSSESDFFLLGMDFANMEFFEYLVYAIPQRSGTYDYFVDNLQIFTEPIPRLWWSGKPVGEPLRRIELFQYGYPIGMTRSLPGEGWYALGWLGVVLWCGLWGATLGTIYRRFVAGPQSTMRVACYLIFLSSLIIGYRDGTLLQVVRSTGVYFAPIATWYVMARLLGVPRLGDLRAASRESPLARERQSLAAAALPDHLPPAVRRRRLALQRTAE